MAGPPHLQNTHWGLGGNLKKIGGNTKYSEGNTKNNTEKNPIWSNLCWQPPMSPLPLLFQAAPTSGQYCDHMNFGFLTFFGREGILDQDLYWHWGNYLPEILMNFLNLQSPVPPCPGPSGKYTNRSCGVDISIPYNVHLSTPYNINLVRQNLHRAHCVLTPSPVYRNPRDGE